MRVFKDVSSHKGKSNNKFKKAINSIYNNITMLKMELEILKPGKAF